ncbi:MAG: 2OG-Fe dioxygenase family protein [Burkholderiales bacterium]|nr:2OG-Fe dioxygenase family protein [Burkholderiales bacterium]
MTTATFPPPCAALGDALPALQRQGYAVLSAQSVSALTHTALTDLMALVPSWNDLPPDQYLKDGGRYRRRRHASYVIRDGQLQPVPHRAHWQPLEYNALHGGMQRWFEAVLPETAAQSAWSNLLLALGGLCSQLKGQQPWFVEAHQFRIDTTDGIGRPTPEGAHRDGVDLVAVFLVGREGVKGGETRVFEAAGPNGQRFTLSEPWSLLLLDDRRVIHESTPIQPLDPDGHRDTLVITLRAEGFQDDIKTEIPD